MKKERVLKYLILICAMIMSFFIFASGGVNALEYSVNDGKIILSLEQVDGEDESKGYVISGARLADGVTTIGDWTMPANYEDNGYPIVAIKDGANNQSGVLNSLAEAINGKIVLGENLESIGLCAFCNFSNVTEYELNENLSIIGEYAFAYNISLKTIVIKAYNTTKTELTNINSFNSSINFKRLVFKNSGIAKAYKNEVDGWNSLSGVLFTYKVKYLYYNEDNSSFIPVDYYFNERLGSVPADIEKKGLEFSWVTNVADKIKEVNENSIAMDVGQLDENFEHILVVKPQWVLKGTNKLSIRTSVNGVVTDHTESVKSIETTYSGKNDKLSIQAIVGHEFIEEGDPNFTISFSWVRMDSNNIPTPVIGGDSIFVYQTGESGTYICTVTLSYPGYTNVFENVKINVNIKKKDVIINVADRKVEYGTYLTNVDNADSTYYSIDESTPLAEGETIKKFNFSGYCSDVNSGCEKSSVGIIQNVLLGQVVNVGYEGDNENYSDHYNFTYVKGDLTIEPKIIGHTLEQNLEVIYGNSDNLIEEKPLVIYGENIIIKIKYIREDSSNSDAGTYEVLNASVVKENNVQDNNYKIQLSAINPGKIVIKPKPVEVEWDIDDNRVYDGTEKSISAYYNDINNLEKSLFVTVKKNNELAVVKNAGDYVLTASMIANDLNYELVNFVYDLKIDKAESELIGNETQSVTYNGKPQRVNLSLNPGHDGSINYGNYDHCKNANETTATYCYITVTVDETENYTEIKEKTYALRILRVKKEVEPKLFELTYGTILGNNSLCDNYPGVGDDTVSVCFNANITGNDEIAPVGYHHIQSAFTNDSTNYDIRLKSGTGSNKVKINPAPIEVKFYFYEGLVYDGNVKDIHIKYVGTEEKLELLTYYGEKEVIKDAGDYRIEVSIKDNKNYFIDGKNYIEFTIAKAKYDVSGLKLNDKEITFNFKSHYINLEGDLPSGLKAIYTIDGEKGNGTYLPFKHTVKVSFEGDYANYEYVDPITATLYVDMTWVWIALSLILFFGGVIPVAIYLLIFKYKVIKFEALRKALSRKNVSRLEIIKMMRKNRQLERLNQTFREKQAAWYASQNNAEEEIEIIEEPIKFVKNPVNTKPESLIEMSFVDELFKSSYGTKQLYSEIKNELLSYEGIVSKIKRDFETFYLNNIPVAKLDVVKGTLIVYLALDPNQYKKEEYKHVDVSKEKDFASVPLKLTVKTLESLRHAKMFVRIIRKREGIKAVSNFIRTDYVDIYTAKEDTFSLFKKAFVKKGTKEYEED